MEINYAISIRLMAWYWLSLFHAAMSIIRKTNVTCHRKSVVLSGSCPAFASMIFTSAKAFSARSPDGPAWTVHFGSGQPTHVLDSTACTAYNLSKIISFVTHFITSCILWVMLLTMNCTFFWSHSLSYPLPLYACHSHRLCISSSNVMECHVIQCNV